MGKKNDNKKSKKRIRFKGLLIVILFLYLVFSCFYYLWTKPIKNINIEGNYYLKDNYIIDYLNIEDTSILKINNKKIKNKLLEIDLISDAVIKRDFRGYLTIEIEEEKVLFYNWNTKNIVLSNGSEIDYNSNYLGIPTLINSVPDDIYDELVEKLILVEDEAIKLVSEIEYSPSEVNGKIVDEKRFLFRMNDGNIVYINTINIEKFNNYLNIYEAIVSKNGEEAGCLYLDSNSGDTLFNNCEKDMVVEAEDGTDEN